MILLFKYLLYYYLNIRIFIITKTIKNAIIYFQVYLQKLHFSSYKSQFVIVFNTRVPRVNINFIQLAALNRTTDTTGQQSSWLKHNKSCLTANPYHCFHPTELTTTEHLWYLKQYSEHRNQSTNFHSHPSFLRHQVYRTLPLPASTWNWVGQQFFIGSFHPIQN